MKKFVSMLIILCMSFCMASATAFAAVPDDSGISPLYLYADDVQPNAYFATSNSVKYNCTVKGRAGTTQIKIYLYLEEYYNGSWRTVDAVSKTVNAKDGYVSDTYTSAVSGRKYRAYASVFVYKGSAYEHIEEYSK